MNPLSFIKAKISYFFLRILIASWTWAGKKYRGVISDRIAGILQRVHDRIGAEGLQPPRQMSRN